MNRIDACFERLRGTRAAFVPYVTAGDPTPDATVAILDQLAANGADIIEIGMPFSDPMADGPVIQAACERALRQGTDLHHVLDAVSRFRTNNRQTPIVLMGYMNPLERFGSEAFCAAAAGAGVDGLLLVDLPPEESAHLNGVMHEVGLHQIFLVAPTTSERRLQQVATLASGFIYHVSLKGITGAGNLDVDAVALQVARIRSASQLPIAVGFGVRTPQDVRALGQLADAVVVGSALVDAMAKAPEQAAQIAGKFAASLTGALVQQEDAGS